MRLRQRVPTDRERETFRGEATVSRTYSYQIRTRVRGEVDQLAGSTRFLEAHHLAWLERVVCDPD